MIDNKSKHAVVLKEIKRLMGNRNTIDFKEIVTKVNKIRDWDTRDLMNALIHWDVNGMMRLQMKRPA